MIFRLLLACSALLGLAGCLNDSPSPPPAGNLPGSHWFELQIGGRTVEAQLAVTSSEMSRGLMGRTELGEDRGMLFVYRRPMQASFWMRNTPLPLDIGFFNPDGVLLEVYPMYPYDETSVRSRSDQIQFALEMNQGWFSRNGVRPGARLEREDLRRALGARGFAPDDFGL